jgi:hypothetical protein
LELRHNSAIPPDSGVAIWEHVRDGNIKNQGLADRIGFNFEEGRR